MPESAWSIAAIWRKSSRSKTELPIAGGARGSGGACPSRHAASSSRRGRTWSSVISADHAAFDRQDALDERTRHLGGDVGGRADGLGVTVRMPVTASTSSPATWWPTCATMMTWRADGSLAGRPRRAARSTIGQHGAAQVDDPAHESRGVRQRRRRRPAADLAHGHDVDAELLLADDEGDQLARLGGFGFGDGFAWGHSCEWE